MRGIQQHKLRQNMPSTTERRIRWTNKPTIRDHDRIAKGKFNGFRIDKRTRTRSADVQMLKIHVRERIENTQSKKKTGIRIDPYKMPIRKSILIVPIGSR